MKSALRILISEDSWLSVDAGELMVPRPPDGGSHSEHRRTADGRAFHTSDTWCRATRMPRCRGCSSASPWFEHRDKLCLGASIALVAEVLQIAACRTNMLISAIHLAQRKTAPWIKPDRLWPPRKPRTVDLVALLRCRSLLLDKRALGFQPLKTPGDKGEADNVEDQEAVRQTWDLDHAEHVE